MAYLDKDGIPRVAPDIESSNNEIDNIRKSLKRISEQIDCFEHIVINSGKIIGNKEELLHSLNQVKFLISEQDKMLTMNYCF